MLGQGAVVESAHGPIAYGEMGEGSAILVVHGTPGGADQGLALARILGLRDHRIVSPSRPGYLGTRLTVGREPEEQAEAFAALLDALGIDRAALIANSAGGAFSVPFALTYPERISRLILLQSITARMKISVDSLLHAALLLPRSASVAPSVVGLALRRVEPSLIAQSVALAWSTLPIADRRAGVLNDALQISRLPSYPLEALQVPTLLVHGEADEHVPYAQSVAAAAAIPGARLVSVPGGITRRCSSPGRRVRRCARSCARDEVAGERYGLRCCPFATLRVRTTQDRQCPHFPIARRMGNRVP